MNPIELGNPVPRDVELKCERFDYHVLKRSSLPVGGLQPATPFFQVLRTRQSRRSFGPLDNGALGALLWHSARTIQANRDSNENGWDHRPTPSAGGRHPVDLVILGRSPADPKSYLYNPAEHCLDEIRIADRLSRISLESEARSLVNAEEGVVIWLVAEFHVTLAKYANGESLVWRDAGALVATMHLVAEAMCLNFCALGITGEPLASRMLGGRTLLWGVGGCVIGARRDLQVSRI
jgi:SagB-type dehydrogenase family enzyme